MTLEEFIAELKKGEKCNASNRVDIRRSTGGLTQC